MKKVVWGIIPNYVFSNPRVWTACQRDDEDQIGWKGAYIYDGKKHKCKPILVKLYIPASAQRTRYYTENHERYSKHRCEVAKVLGFYSYYTGKELKSVKEALSFFTGTNMYQKDCFVFPTYYSYRNIVCGQGIHFFYEKKCALMYLDYMGSEYNYKLRKNNMWEYDKK